MYLRNVVTIVAILVATNVDTGDAKNLNDRLASRNACQRPFGLFSDPSDPTCKKYFNCDHGVPYPGTCSPQTVFNPQMQNCVWPWQYTCPNTGASPPTTTTTSNEGPCQAPFGLFPDPSDPTCKKYFNCAHGVPYPGTCAHQTVFDPQIQNCVWRGQYTCPNSDAPTASPPTNPTPSPPTNPTPSPPTNPTPSPPTNPTPSPPTPTDGPSSTTTITTSSSTTTTTGGGCSSAKKIVCYYPNWAIYRSGSGKFSVEDIDSTLCTHIVYSFSVLSPNTLEMIPYDYNDAAGQNYYQKFQDLRTANPNVKLLLAFGGYTDSQNKKYAYKQLLNNANSRANFVQSSIEFLKKYNFDGLDLDYEFPDAQDKSGFATLVKELSVALKPLDYELTAAISAAPYKINEGLDVPVLSQYLDAIHIMAYDLHGSWENKADNHAPLMKRPWDTVDLNCDYTVNLLLQKGATADKLVLGIPTYGRSWTVTGGNKTPPAPASGGGTPGTYTKEDGFLGYQEICLKVKSGWTEVIDSTGSYAYGSNQWVGYDAPLNAREKAQYVIDKDLGGAMFWELSTDDFDNKCGKGKFPIITAVNEELKKC